MRHQWTFEHWYCLLEDGMLESLKCFVVEKNGIFVHFNRGSKISLHSRTYSLRHVVTIKVIAELWRILKINFWQDKNNNFIEFKVHLIHSKKVPLLHNTVLIYAMKEVDWWPFSISSYSSLSIFVFWLSSYFSPFFFLVLWFLYILMLSLSTFP